MQTDQQNTGRESNPAHFSVIRILPAPHICRFALGFPLPATAETPIGKAPCPLSAHSDGKLMPKIHRLTDN